MSCSSTPDALHGDPHQVAVVQGDLVAGDDAGAGEQDRTGGKGELVEERGDELVEAALHLGDRCRAGEDPLAVAVDLELDRGRARIAGVAGQHDRPRQPERVVVDLGLGR